MSQLLETRLSKLISSGEYGLLRNGLKGIEKESLRVGPDGTIAQTPHPAALGSALTHPHITTDYSEALLEFITPAFAESSEVSVFLSDIHQFVYQNIGNELLWATSMPCILSGELSIPIAEYGSSNIGRMKHVYRHGLWHRYGRSMQAISGVHFNYSLPESFWPAFHALENSQKALDEFISEQYFALVRNVRRLGWLIIYLFGASPAICKSFMGTKASKFQQLGDGTLYEPYATSLRMSDIGYKNNNQASLNISYNSLDAYVKSLKRAIETPSVEYANIGVVDNGIYKQLNTNKLQIENEYYSIVRPKQVAKSGEKPTVALQRRGVRYVELRALDVNPFDPVGITEQQCHFLEAFMIYCLLSDSPAINGEESEIDANLNYVAVDGRNPDQKLIRDSRLVGRGQWANEILDEMVGICEILDGDTVDKPYSAARQYAATLFEQPDRTPSARTMSEITEHDGTFFHFAMRKSHEHEQMFKQQPLSPSIADKFQRLAAKSLEKQKQIELSDRLEFDQFLADYFAQTTDVS